MVWSCTNVPLCEVLKIDVEGSEWEVLQGAGALLAGGHVLCVVLEYSHFWSQMTLKGLARWMLEKGYDGYLVGSPHLVPVSGAGLEWWHDLYEVCARPDSRIYRGLAGWCWLNVAFVLRGSWLGTLAAQWLPQVQAKQALQGFSSGPFLFLPCPHGRFHMLCHGTSIAPVSLNPSQT